jgi:glutamine amidotransferase
MSVGIVNYRMGNVFSIKQTVEKLGYETFIANYPDTLNKADKIILPGVGSFKKAMENLNEGGWTNVLNKLVKMDEIPLLGICLGMHLLGQSSNEVSLTKGLSFVNGHVVNLNQLGCKLRIPHVGWNDVKMKKKPLFDKIAQNSDFYFVHSYAFKHIDKELIFATTSYDIEIIAVIKSKNIFGMQFHPEKSSLPGKQLLKNFLRIMEC